MPTSHRKDMDRVAVTHNDIAVMTHVNGGSFYPPESPAHRAETIRFIGLIPDPLPPNVAALVEGICDQR